MRHLAVQLCQRRACLGKILVESALIELAAGVLETRARFDQALHIGVADAHLLPCGELLERQAVDQLVIGLVHSAQRYILRQRQAGLLLAVGIVITLDLGTQFSARHAIFADRDGLVPRGGATIAEAAEDAAAAETQYREAEQRQEADGQADLGIDHPAENADHGVAGPIYAEKRTAKRLLYGQVRAASSLCATRGALSGRETDWGNACDASWWPETGR